MRDRQALLDGRGAVFGVAAAGDERADAVALGDGARPVHDGSGDLEARQVGRAWRRRILAEPLHDVRTVDTGGRDADEHFTGRGSRNGAFDEAQDVGPARFRDLDRAHRFGNSGHDRRLSHGCRAPEGNSARAID